MELVKIDQPLISIYENTLPIIMYDMKRSETAEELILPIAQG